MGIAIQTRPTIDEGTLPSVVVVRSNRHQQAPTPEGIAAIERGELRPFDPQVFANFNTGILEQYLDEHARIVGFAHRAWTLRAVSAGLIVGALFAVITMYVGLRIGLAVTGSWYVVYLLGLALRWPAAETNVASANSAGTSLVGIGFIYAYPAIFLLAYSPRYRLADGTSMIGTLPPLWLGVVTAALAAIMGVMFFVILRRIWLVDTPLPVPGFESYVKLLDISHHLSQGTAQVAARSIRLVMVSAGLSAGFAILRDAPITRDGSPPLDTVFGGSTYHAGTVMQPLETATYTQLSIGLSPLAVALGWFMRTRAAFVFAAGSLFAWLVVIPMAVGFHEPVYIPQVGLYVDVNDPGLAAIGEGAAPSLVAFRHVVQVMAIGAILGGGVAALAKMMPSFRGALVDAMTAPRGESAGWIRGRGWYEWPLATLLPMAVLTFVGIVAAFAIAGFPVLLAVAFALILLSTSFFLGAIAVKVMGETGTEPVSGTSFLTLLAVVATFVALGATPEVAAVMGIVGATAFAGAITMSGNIISDFKAGLYIANRPYHLTRGLLTSVVPGVVVSGLAMTVFATGLSTGAIDLPAPQANAFATFTQLLVGGKINLLLFVAGFVIGIGVEYLSGMGTAFGLGMYLPLALTLPFLVGGLLRDWWQKRMEEHALADGWEGGRKALAVMDTYMVATGLLVGEAVVGTIIALAVVLPLVF